MAGKISELQIAQPLQGDEFVELIQKDAAGTYKNRRVAVSELKGLKGEEGLSAYQIAVENGFQGTPAEWLASLKGANGKSAFEVAQEAGFEGSPEDWLATLRGEQGKSAYEVAQEHGFEGSFEDWVESMRGPQGVEGQSAYQAAIVYGFEGTEEEWLASLKGERGLSAYEQAVDNGFEGSVEEWIESLRGADGRSAFELAQAEGFEGSQAEWVESLRGEDGKSAYDLAVEGGFEGDVVEWLLSLTGPQGKSAYELALEQGFEGTEEEWLESLKGETGSGLRILGSFGSTVWLPTHNNQPGDAYIVNYVMWVWEGKKWVPVGQVGPTGKSAYQIAVEQGFSGSASQWLNSLKGDSAYQVAVAQGYVGSQASWLASLKGDPGQSAYQVAVQNGFQGNQLEWLASLVGPQGPQGEKGDKGDPANAIKVVGGVASEAELPTEVEPGDGYFINRSLWVWTGERWFDAGEIKGPQGEKGEKGDQGDVGRSAYEVALENGFEGTATEWLESLKGEQGLSAYEVARLEGFNGSEAEWLESLRGGQGLSAYEVAVIQGYQGTEDEWLESLRGDDGAEGPQGPEGPMGRGLTIDGAVASEDALPAEAPLNAVYLVGRHLFVKGTEGWVDAGEMVGPSAYDLAVEQGFEGDLNLWLLSLEGKTAYEVAVEQGFLGTEDEWLASLKGEKGDKGDQGEQGDPGAQLAIQDVLESVEELPAEGTVGVGYLVQGNLLAWVNGAWKDLGTIRGPDGLSAYELAQQSGFTGSLEDWLASLKGDQGEQGIEGKSAYEIAVEQGFNGTLEDWLDSLKGEIAPAIRLKGYRESEDQLPEGASQYDAYVIGGNVWAYVGDPLAWVDLGPFGGPQGPQGEKGEKGDKGDRGESNYEIAVRNGFEGTEAEWLKSIEGLSAYEVFLKTFPDSTMNEMQWLESLNGNRWIVMDGEPGPLVGNVGDFYMDATNQQYYQKVNQTQWGSMGYIGGGNVYDAPKDGEFYVRKDGGWVVLTAEVEEAPEDGQQYIRKDRNWAVLKAEVEEAPDDGQQYVRLNKEWSVLKAEVEEVPKPIEADPENPDIEPTDPNKRYVRQYKAWAEVVEATPEMVREGTNTTAQMTPKAMHDLLASMGITYDPALGDWVNDEGTLE